MKAPIPYDDMSPAELADAISYAERQIEQLKHSTVDRAQWAVEVLRDNVQKMLRSLYR